MFGFANGLLLLLLAAAVIDFAPVVRRRLSPASWWNDERLLFTPRGGISIYPYANYGRPGTKYEQMAEHRLMNRE